MNNDLLNILSNSNKDIDNQKLMDYLSGKLSEQDRHEVEKWMVDNDFDNEAMEGLQQITGTTKIEGYVDQLNKGLHQYIGKKKSRRGRGIKEAPWVYLAIFLTLVLAVIAFVIIRQLMMHR